ncbi:MAG: alpha/beta fold hydrolase [Polyangiaceae bacterium]|nr:alpha/beta fold hydrolase [Polyangiaceae bacterium]
MTTPTPRPAEPAAPAKETIETKTTHLVEAMSEGKFGIADDMFDETMLAALGPDKLEVAWRSVEKSAGKFEAIDSIEITEKDAHSIALAKTKFERARLVVRVVYDKDGKVAGLFFQPLAAEIPWSAPAYADASRFEEREVEVGSAPALPGTATLPRGSGPFPAVVLVHGSGPNDRDETVGGAKPFKDLAWGLASKGIAVLRYVKRSRHSPSGIVTQKEEVLDGVRDAVARLRDTPEVDKRRIVVLGHSQGGYLAPRIGVAHPELAGIVILAGSTRPLEDSMIEQLTYLGSLDSKNEGLKSALEAARVFKKKVTSPTLTATDTIDLPTGGSVTGAYFLDVRGYEPPAVAKKLTLPLLVLQGERDYQVTTRDFEGWKSALASKKTVTLRTYPSLNHLFISGSGTPSPAEYGKEGHVDEKVIGDIAAWVNALAPAAGK